jgi:kumamolisin
VADIPENYRPIKGSERHPSPGTEKLGPADPNEIVRLTIVLRRREDGPPMPGMDYFLSTPIGRRGRMPDDEFAAKYGASPDDLAKVVRFVESAGLRVVEAHAARRSVVVAGTVELVSRAFAVDLDMYRYTHHRQPGRSGAPETEVYRGRDGFIYAPEDVVDSIVGVFGLDNRRITKRNAADPPNTATISVQAVTDLYNFPTNSAQGQTIAILSEAGYQMGDITTYYANQPAGFTAPNIRDISVGANNDGTADGETTQDICIAATAAPGAAIAVYFTSYSQQGWVDLIGRIAHPSAGDPVCSVLSSSFYVSNGDDAGTLASEHISESWLDAVTQAFNDAALQHVTVCIATGDTGTDSKVGDGKAHVQYPASDPWVLAVGGTTVGNIVGRTFDEYVWNDTFFGGAVGATGGGVSDKFDVPPYQAATNIPVSLNDGRKGRAIPDVAANASPNSGYPIVVGGAASVGNGTSASAPLWAGLIAVLNAALGGNAGFINPAIYAMGSAGFRDIEGAPGPADNGLNGVPGYPAGPGWDAATGWGSPNGQALLAALRARFAAPAAA